LSGRERWVWCSLAFREKKLDKRGMLFDDGPVNRSQARRRAADRSKDEKELARLRQRVPRGRPGK
jgi:hypothetical protein